MANEDKTLEAIIKLKDEMSSELKKVQKGLDNLQDSAQDANKALAETEKTSKGTKNALVGMGLQQAGEKMMQFSAKIMDAVKSLLELTEATKEFNTLSGKLEGSSKQYGYTKEASNNSAKSVYSYTGDEMSAFNSVQNLQGLGLSQKDLDKTLGSAISVWTAYGDSIPIESLTESMNETAQVGKVTGVLADALNWAGISEDNFNKKLESCKTTQEKNKLITDTLNGAYGDSKKVYDEANKALMDYNGSQWDSINASAQLGETLAPLNSAISSVKASIIEALAPAIQSLVQFLQPVIAKVQEFIQNNPELVSTIALVVGILGSLCAILGPLLIIIGIVMTTGLAPLILIFLKVSVVIGIVISICVALAQSWERIKENCATLRDNVIKAFTELKEKVGNAINYIKDAWNNFVSLFTTPIKAVVNYVTGGSGANGSHASGLSRVPYNNYLANLHEGERILTRREADNYENGNRAGINIFMNGTTIREEADINKIASTLVRKINEQKIIVGG